MPLRASTVETCLAVGAFGFAAVCGVRLQADSPTRSVRLQADLVRLKPDTTNYADGAPPGFSGGFGESACDACHFEAAVNTPPGRVTLTGIPERYAAGQAYPIMITLSRPGMMLGGFQLAARFEDGGAQAGTLAPAPGEEKRIKLETGKVHYANQRLDGTGLAEPGIAKWTLLWTAPPTPGVVRFNVAANAADKDEAARGDYVYTAAATSRSQ
jgi:hypothetical protein